MNKKVLNTLIICSLIVITGLIVYIYYSLGNKTEEENIIRLSKDTIDIYVGEKERLFILPEDAVYDEIIWQSENNSVASVNDGLVTGNSVGNTIINIYSNEELLDRCIVKVSKKDTEKETPVTPPKEPEKTDPKEPEKTDPKESEKTDPEPETPKPVTSYIVKYYGASIVDTGLSSITLASASSLPEVKSKALSLSPGSLYVVSFDYKTVRGTNKFNTDLNPDDLPEKQLTATTVLNHFDWEVSSSSNNMRNCKLRFFDNQRAVGDSDIIISNITVGTIRRDTKTKGSTIGSLPTPVRSGYTFLGWYTSRIGGTKVTTSTKVNSDMTLYPHWEEKIRILPNEYIVPRGYSVVSNATYNSNTLKYKTIKLNDSKAEKYYSLIYVKDANRQMNSANNYLRGGQRQTLLNDEIVNYNLKSKGMIATNGSFTISERSNTAVIASKGTITINNRYSSNYEYGTLTVGADNMLKYYTTSNTSTLSNWLKAVGARNTWAITHFNTSDWNGGRSDGADRRTSICQVDSHNFVLYAGYSLGIGDYMKELHDMFGCISVINLDGGGSTGMYYKTKGMSKVGVIYEYKRTNDCCRVVGDMLYFTE